MVRLVHRRLTRPRTVRPAARTALRLESLETRANPSAPVLTGVSVDWSNPGVVAISGHVVDETPATTQVQVGGAATGTFATDGKGQFAIVLKTLGTGGLYIRALDAEGLTSNPISYLPGTQMLAVTAVENPTFGDISISHEQDGWHIRGHVDGGSIGTIIKIINGPGDCAGQTGNVGDDGSFDIVINLPSDGSGGGISIIAIDQDTGSQSDQWDGILG
jgi:hypothetical protein